MAGRLSGWRITNGWCPAFCMLEQDRQAGELQTLDLQNFRKEREPFSSLLPLSLARRALSATGDALLGLWSLWSWL